MDWIKRNLYFVIGSVVALALMGLAGWYLYTKWELNNEILKQLDEQYVILQGLNTQNPNPGEDGPGKIDNIKEAKEQQQQLRAFTRKTRNYFQRIPPIPDVPKFTDQNFSSALSLTIDQLQKAATSGSVGLPPKSATGSSYSFSFEAEKSSVSFRPASLPPLAAQLGEVKAICDVLIQAKINSLDNVRRESVAAEDQQSTQAQTDYLAGKSVTNELAVLSPYEVSFRCFSSELAAVLAGFASSPYGMLVKTINVELAPAAAVEEPQPVVAQPVMMQPPVAPPPPRRSQSESDAFRQRYGIGPGGGLPRGGPAPPRQEYTPAVPMPPTVAATPSPQGGATHGGLQIVLDEKQLKVTMTLDIVKLAGAK